jgi:hypothetical protein
MTIDEVIEILDRARQDLDHAKLGISDGAPARGWVLNAITEVKRAKDALTEMRAKQ